MYLFLAYWFKIVFNVLKRIGKPRFAEKQTALNGELRLLSDEMNCQ